MRTRASIKSATVVGALAGLLVQLAGPQIDAEGPASSVWLVVCAIAIGIPGYFYVLGIPTEELKGLRVLGAPLLKRASAFLLAAGAVLALAIASSHIKEFGQIDRCLDGGGGWDYQHRACEPESSK